jgi:hypothetical protein
MATKLGQTVPLPPNALPPWHVEVAQLLEEHHMVAWAHLPADRARFGLELADALTQFDDTQVCQLHGAHISDIFSFCNQLERAMGDDRIRRSIDARGGVVDALRRRPQPIRGRAIRRRFYLWHDADVMLRADHKLFGRLVDAIAGVAAEAEYASEDMLLLHRAIFIGAPSLDVYAEDPRGQFSSWLSEESEVPLWRVVSGLDVPPFIRYRIEPVLRDEKVPLVEAPTALVPVVRKRRARSGKLGR